MTWTRYEIETRWEERGFMLAWQFAAEFRRKQDALAVAEAMRKYPRKTSRYQARVVEVVWDDDGRLVHSAVIPEEIQLELPLNTPRQFVSGLPERTL